MAAYINTNIASLNAQRNLTMSQSALQTSIQRLSSGLRINSAKDDAAGLAIAERFTTQINGLDQAGRNANDGISLSQTAEGALASVSDNLQRIRELSVQAANSTNSASDRAAINQEVQQRLAEIDRTTSQTSFNGQKILDGSFGNATFQVGANAGETISIGLNTSMRTSAIGSIASTTTTGAVGASATGGSITTGALTLGDFSHTTTSAVDASIEVTPTTLLFGSTAQAGSGGSVTITAPTPTDFSANVAATNASYDTTITAADMNFTASGNAAHFTIHDSAGNDVVIALDGTDYSANASGFQTDVNAALSAAGSNDTVAVTDNGATWDFKITAGDTAGAGSVAPDISASGADATTAGITASGVGGASQAAGSDATDASAEFSVDGHTVHLTGNDASVSDIATEIDSALNGSGYTTSVVNGNIVIENNTLGSAAPVVADAGTAAQTANFHADIGTVAGINATAQAGQAPSSDTSASFSVDGQAISLSSDYTSVDDLINHAGTGLQAQLDALAPSTYSVTNDSGAVKISKIGDTGAALAITGADANATAAGFANAVTGTAGSAADTDSSVSFTVDSTAVHLTGDYSGGGGLASFVSDLGTALGAGYSVAQSGSGVKITNATAGSDAVVISGSDTNANTAGITDATGTAGVVGGTVTLTDFSIKSGDNDAVSLNGTYASVDDLATEINKSVNNVYATVSSGKLVLTSSADITLSGTDATGAALGFASDTATANSGSLNNIDTLTAADANDAIQRVDSALTAVNGLRSTFGAIQNRFESVISNLSQTSENLSAARSRIQDADFASETANMTRAQILQQAGTAMLAQANSLPNGVLALLR